MYKNKWKTAILAIFVIGFFCLLGGLSANASAELTPDECFEQTNEYSCYDTVDMVCGDSSGGDGVYSMCKSDTLYHSTGVTLFNRAYDPESLRLMATGLTDTYFRIYLNTPETFYKADGTALHLKYTGKTDSHGAFLQVSQEGKGNESVEDAPATSEGSGSSDSGMLPAYDDSETESEVRTCVDADTGGKRKIAFGDSKVYYVKNSIKHWFPSEEIYLSWYSDFSGLEMVTAVEMNGYATGENVCKKTENFSEDAPATSEGSGSSDSGMLPAYNEEIVQQIRTAGDMVCGDSSGGDGLYSACKGDFIKHSSGINIMVRAYDSSVVKFMLENTENTYARVGMNNYIEAVSVDGLVTLKLTYKEKTSKHGAFVKVETMSQGDDVEEIDTDGYAGEPKGTGSSIPEGENDTDGYAGEPKADSSTIPEGENDTDGYAGEPKSSSESEVEEDIGGTDIDFKVSVNDYPEHQNYNLNKNLTGAYVNMYYVELQSDGMFKVGEAEIKGTQVPVDGGDPIATFTVAPGKMVYFEGFKSYNNALDGITAKMAINWSAPPYKNFSYKTNVQDKLCQTNFTDTDNYLSCSNNLSTPYTD